MGSKYFSIGLQHALRTQPDLANSRLTFEHGGCLPAFGDGTAFEPIGIEWLALKVGVNVFDPNSCQRLFLRLAMG